MGRGGGGLRVGLVVVGLLRMKAGKVDGGPWKGVGVEAKDARTTLLSAESRDCQRCILFKPPVNRP